MIVPEGLKLDWLVGLEAVAETGNVTRAGKRIGLSQPALHAQMAQLSEWAGGPVLRRSGRGVALTARGDRVLALARRVRSEIVRFQEDLAEVPVVVTAGRATHLWLLAEPLRTWVAGAPSWPSAPLRLRSEDGADALASVLSGRAHVGVAPLERPVPRLLSAPYRRAGVRAVLRADHPLAGRAELGLIELSCVPLLLPPAPRPHRLAVDRAFAAADLTYTPAFELEGWDLLVHYASLGLGVALVNDYVPLPPGAVGIPAPDLPAVELRVFTPRDGPVHPGARPLFDHLAARGALTYRNDSSVRTS